MKTNRGGETTKSFPRSLCIVAPIEWRWTWAPTQGGVEISQEEKESQNEPRRTVKERSAGSERRYSQVL